MPMTWTDTPDAIDWDALETLYRLAPLGHKPAAHLRTVFTNSRFTCFAHDDQGVLVAAGRALADGADCSYICDVAVLPSHQGTGLGREVVARLVGTAAVRPESAQGKAFWSVTATGGADSLAKVKAAGFADAYMLKRG